MVRVYTPKKSEALIQKALALLETIKSTQPDDNLKTQILQVRKYLNEAIDQL